MGCPGQSQQGQMDQIIALQQVGEQVAGCKGQASTERQIGGEPGNAKQRVRVDDSEPIHAFAISYKIPIAC
jgi:hypothetical protein